MLKQVDYKGTLSTFLKPIKEDLKSFKIKYSSGKFTVENPEVTKLELFNEKGQLLNRAMKNSIPVKTPNHVNILNIYIGNNLVKSEKIILQQ
jgi:hypothetical protein